MRKENFDKPDKNIAFAELELATQPTNEEKKTNVRHMK